MILAGISCWATEQSLHLLLPTGWPEVLVWGITIAFFVVASLGTKMIADTLNSPAFIDNRKVKLFGGILLVIFFWLLMSMPTNTHTFFYNDKIGSVITKDIETTNKYLTQIITKGTASETLVLDAKGKMIKDSVEDLRTHIVAQFNGDEAPFQAGNGPIIGEYLKQINKILNANIQQDPNRYSKDKSIINRYHVEIDRALFDVLKAHTISAQSVDAARTQKRRLMALNDSIKDHISTGNVSDAEIKQCETELGKGYGVIANNRIFVDFDTDTDDEIVYTKENADTRTKRMASVIDVFFVDFLQGKYPASFWYYVILSILVDVAAFIFFDIAFKKDDNYYN